MMSVSACVRVRWLRGLDLNQRPSGYEPDELPGCSTPRQTRGRRTVCASVVGVLCEGMYVLCWAGLAATDSPVS